MRSAWPSGLVVFAMCLAAAAGAQVAAPPGTSGNSIPLFAGDSASSWTAQNKGEKVVVASGVMTVAERAGWVQFERIAADFVLRFEARTLSPAGRAFLVVRGHQSNRDPLGYALTLTADVSAASRSNMTMLPIGAALLASARRPLGEWQTYEVRSDDDRVSVTVNGALVASACNADRAAGWIGVRAEKGSVDIRNMAIGPASSGMAAFQNWMTNSIYVVGDTITPPKLQGQPRAIYTPAALQANVNGTVVLEFVVGPDGRVTDTRVLRPLGYGLDQEAINALKESPFSPGTKNGTPVSVVATIEMAFAVKPNRAAPPRGGPMPVRPCSPTGS